MTLAYERTSDLLRSSLAFDYQHDASVERTITPLWKEAAWPMEWAKLRCSPVFFGIGVPRGHGETVVLVPGFMAGDLMMLELYRWLRRIGYRPWLSNITWNNDCPDETARKLERRVRAIADRTGDRLRLVGHSLGGMLSKYVVQESPELVDRVITVGSPFRDLVKAHPAIVGIWGDLKLKRSRVVGRNLKPSCGTGHCTCAFVSNMLQPKRVSPPQFSIYSKTDGIVDWTSCVEDDPEANTAIKGSHFGMVYNVAAYRAIAARLAQAIE